jgi:cysteine-rich repeat protein
LGISVDASGTAYVVGDTSSLDFPTVNAVQETLGGSDDAFVAKLSPTGDALVYSTYLGGGASDSGTSIAVDGSGSAYVTGYAISMDFPTVNPFQGSRLGSEDAFVAKLSSSGGSLVYSTYLGGGTGGAGGDDIGRGIAVDASGSATVVGETESTDFPTANPMQGLNAGAWDGFVARFSPAGDALIYSTYLGGSDADASKGVVVDGSGSAHVTGYSSSPDFPTVNALQGTLAGGSDAVVTKLSPQGSLVYSTYLGGSAEDFGFGIAVDGTGSAYVAGMTGSGDFPIRDAVQDSHGPFLDAFLTRLSPDGGAIVYSTFFGDTDPDSMVDEGALGVAVDGAGSAQVAGFARVVPGPDLAETSRGLADAQVDNDDPEDTLADAADAGCHTDGNPQNPASYDPEDNDETDICGDGILHPGEQCDDGNNDDGDGCSSTCTLENQPPDCGSAGAQPSALWPPNHKFAWLAITGVTDPDGDPLTISVTAIRQDEPVTAGTGCGHTCPDGRGDAFTRRAEGAVGAGGRPRLPHLLQRHGPPRRDLRRSREGVRASRSRPRIRLRGPGTALRLHGVPVNGAAAAHGWGPSQRDRFAGPRREPRRTPADVHASPVVRAEVGEGVPFAIPRCAGPGWRGSPRRKCSA